ncbi:peptide MFS transporter [Pedomonas mirosovicensis]|uniref:peptide MFS transporter n=1 Tax=Pedomonas mirosovicensis TaxID=2908641 RepID=UPI002167E651|nr:peptide MFS transporter [Pedomonas mirosovicensis]MCH8685811.1 peptide MFS transporter [Pedomonas mirosovicensis]
MWERFGYYGMRAILILYLTKHFLFDDGEAAGIYASYTALVYLTPLIGGMIADRYLGSRGAVKFGAVMMMLGYFGLAFGGPQTQQFLEYNNGRYPIEIVDVGNDRTEQFVTVDGARMRLLPGMEGSVVLRGTGEAATAPETTLAQGSYSLPVERNQVFLYLMYLSLSFVIIGNGFFKPNISTVVGDLYSPQDKRRENGFYIFYIGINLGSVLGQILLPNLRQNFGFDVAFAAAGVGMTIAWAIATFSDRIMEGYGEAPNPTSLVKKVFAGLSLRWTIYVLAFAALVPAWILVQQNELVGILLATFGFGSYIAMILYAVLKCGSVERNRMIVAVVLSMSTIVFWSLFEQAGTTLTLFADRNTDREVFGWVMPADQVQFFNALFVVSLAPVFAIFWSMLQKRGLEPSTPVKFSLGLVQVGLGFLLLVYAMDTADANGQVALVWLAAAYLLHTMGELCLSPVGLSMITKLSVPRVVGLMMGMWFLSTSLGQYVVGLISERAAVESVGGAVNPHESLAVYAQTFNEVGLFAVGFGIFMLVISPLLKRGMHGVN